MRTNKKSTLIGIAIMLLATGAFLSCSNKAETQEKRNPTEIKIDSLLSVMTLEEKVAMLHANTKFTTGAVKRLGIPGFKMSDGPHGVREEIQDHSWDPAGWTNDSSTYFPTGTALSATWNPRLALATGEALGDQARARGKDVLLGPGVNLQRTPLCGRNFEYMSEDPLLNAKMCVPYIKGVQSKDVAACVKHWAVNNQETDRTTVDAQMSERTLRELYLPAFEAAIKEGGVYTVMGAYNKFRGVYCCESDYLLNTILRKEWDFKGVVISDWDATHSTVAAANNGLDIEMGTEADNYDNYYFANPLIEAVKQNKVTVATIDNKVRSILRIMFRTNMLNNNREAGAYNTKEHYQAAYNVAAEGIVLLKNNTGLLPLDKSKIKTLAVIGDNASRKHCEGGFSSGVKAKYEITPLEGIKKLLGEAVEIKYAQGYAKTSKLEGFKLIPNNELNKDLLKEAVKTASKADMVVVFGGLNHDYDCEGLDRPDMKLPYSQDVLINEILKANKNTVIVMHAGSPVDMSSFVNEAPAIVWGWLNGSEGGTAMADVLFGEKNPSGKMPFTLPVKLEDSPAHHLGLFPGTDKIAKYDEGVFIGYRWFEAKNIKPLFAFGHGLSYTEFKFSDMVLNKKEFIKGDTITLTVTVENTGAKEGAEVVQLYSQDVEASVERPKKELRAFNKVFLKPGEKKQVQLSIDADKLAFYDETAKDWNLEKGAYKLMVGNASDNILLTEAISIK